MQSCNAVDYRDRCGPREVRVLRERRNCQRPAKQSFPPAGSLAHDDMSTMEQVRAAERVMREAQRALLAYGERPSDQQDRDLLRQLSVEAKRAAEDYVKMALALDSQ
jgi:hypothetical protein